ncbi:hypothetical protein GCM10025872_35990 [Barrientosiimonas endolithica]|uniref:DNA topoisomerase (ATP-hydrolyzing) n=1 Tax=Barrientosiimonas endolithica TaxID=1535208 RepID=A0ABM8HFY6_9MICO|nr:hypothetical protein GCM10025872_35990 [Barrientosiimonas endolithica]
MADEPDTPDQTSSTPEPSVAERLPDDGSYGADAIQVLEGLEAVRKRPGMYIGSTGERGLHHLVTEIVDNAVDEYMAGHGDRIDVTLLADGGVRVVDHARGIPVELNEAYGMSTVELVLTQLHAGGKFGGGGYKVSGGLHGVGSSVVNALSTRLTAEVRRDGKIYRVEFEQGCRWRRCRSSARPRSTTPAPPSPSGPAATSSRRPSTTSRRCAPGSSRWPSSTRG